MKPQSRTFVSERIATAPSSGIRRLFDLVASMEDVISLGVGEPDFATPAPILRAGIAALEGGATHYTPNAGLMVLRQAIAGHLERLYGVSYDPASEILLTVGVSEALYVACVATLDPGDEVIIPEPCYFSYIPVVTFAGGTAVTVPTSAEHGWQATTAQIEAAITARTKAILLNHPCNPTGAVLGREWLEQIADLARRYDLLVISDEVYDRLVYGVEHVCFPVLPEMRSRTILLQGFSKSYAMTGWRLGYAAAPAEILGMMHKVHQYAIMCVPTVAQHAALAALQEGEPHVAAMRAEYDRRRRLIVDGLSEMGLTCAEPQGAFYAFPSVAVTGMDDEEFAERLLREERVVVAPGRVFGPSGQGHVRCSYATSREKIEQALERMRRFVDRYG